MSENNNGNSTAHNRGRSITQGIGSLTVQTVISSGVAFVFLAIVLRSVSLVDYTAYSGVLISVTVAAVISTFGFQFAAARYISLFYKEEAKAWSAAKSVFVLSLIFSIIVTVVFELLSQYLSVYYMKNTRSTFLFELGGLWLFTYSISTVLRGIVQGLKKYVLLSKMLSISRFILLSFAVIFLAFTHEVSFAIIGWIISYIFIIFWCLKVLGRNLLQRYEWRSYSEVIRYSTPLAIAGILGIVASNGDLIIAGGYLSSLGIYNAVVQISSVLGIIIVGPLITALLPETSTVLSNNAKVSNAIKLSSRFLFLTLIPASFLMAALSSQLLSLFSGGGAYLVGVESLQLISLTYIFYGLHSTIYSMMQALGQTIQALIVSAVAMVTDIGMAILLVPSFGILGATYSRIITAIIGLVITIYFIRNYVNKLDSLAFYVKATISSFIPFIVVLGLSLLSSRTITLIPYSIVGSGIFVMLVKVFHLLNDDDKLMLSHLLPGRFKMLLKHI